MDYLPIQASAVPCERVFSSSSETCTKKRNRLSPALLEMLQVLKFSFKKERLDFTKGWATSQKDMVDQTYNADSVDLLASAASSTGSCATDALLFAIAEEEGDNIPDNTLIFE